MVFTYVKHGVEERGRGAGHRGGREVEVGVEVEIEANAAYPVRDCCVLIIPTVSGTWANYVIVRVFRFWRRATSVLLCTHYIPVAAFVFCAVNPSPDTRSQCSQQTPGVNFRQ